MTLIPAQDAAKVLFVCGEYPPMKGGIGDYLECLVNELERGGIEPHLFVRGGAPATTPPPRLLTTYDRWTWNCMSRIHHILQQRHIDWLHLQHNCGLYDGHLASYFLPRYLRWKRWSGRIAVTFHDLNRPWLWPKAGRYRTQVISALATSADVVIAADKADVDELSCFGANVTQIPIGSNIPNKADLDRAEALRLDWHIPNGHTVVGHFGTTHGLDTLLEAVAQLQDSTLILIGKAPQPNGLTSIEKLPDDFHRAIHSLGIADRVRWTGHLSAADVANAMTACDVIALPYDSGASLRRGGFIASLTLGRAVITTCPSSSLAGLEPGHDFLAVPAKDATALTHSIKELSHDRDRRRAIECAAAKAATNLFSWKSIASRHAMLYRTISR